MLAVPQSALGDLLAEAFARPVSRDVAQLLLFSNWLANSTNVRAAAGSREVVKEWFQRADFWGGPRMPLLPGLDRASLPAKGIEVWRGGCDYPETVAVGFNWTLRRDVAARDTREKRPGAPVLVKRIVIRAEIALYWPHPVQLVVLLDPGPYTVDPHAATASAVSEATLQRENAAWLARMGGTRADRKAIERDVGEYSRWSAEKARHQHRVRTRAHPTIRDPSLSSFGDEASL